MDDRVFQKSQFSIYVLHGIEFLMDFNRIRCISETLRKISFMASGSYAKITYIVLIHMSQGRIGLLPLFLREKMSFEHTSLGSRMNKRKDEVKVKIIDRRAKALRYYDSSNKMCLPLKSFKSFFNFLTDCYVF